MLYQQNFFHISKIMWVKFVSKYYNYSLVQNFDIKKHKNISFKNTTKKSFAIILKKNKEFQYIFSF